MRLPDSTTKFGSNDMDVKMANQAPKLWLINFWRAQSKAEESLVNVSRLRYILSAHVAWTDSAADGHGHIHRQGARRFLGRDGVSVLSA